jgi:hypothetical protein
MWYLELCNLKPRITPPFPLDDSEEVLALSMSRVDLNNQTKRTTTEEEIFDIVNDLGGTILSLRADSKVDRKANDEEVTACAVSADGGIIFAVGPRGRMWVWERNDA